MQYSIQIGIVRLEKNNYLRIPALQYIIWNSDGYRLTRNEHLFLANILTMQHRIRMDIQIFWGLPAMWCRKHKINAERGRIDDIRRTEGDVEEESYMIMEDNSGRRCYIHHGIRISNDRDHPKKPTCPSMPLYQEALVEGFLAFKGPQQRQWWQENQSTDDPASSWSSGRNRT